jgi:hypothetical protein
MTENSPVDWFKIPEAESTNGNLSFIRIREQGLSMSKHHHMKLIPKRPAVIYDMRTA